MDRLLTLARGVVLARLLVPEYFGLLGIALLSMAFLEAFFRTGFGAALVQRRGTITDYLDTAWTAQLLRGVIMAAALFLAAGYIAAFFNVPDARPVIQVISAGLLIRGLTNAGVVYFQKDLQFHKQFIYNIGQAVAAFTVAVPLALLWRNVWALVFGVLAGDFVGLVLSYVIHPYRPRFHFDFQKARELYTFGRWVYLSTLIGFISAQLDKGAVGKLLGATSLGLYQMGSNISNTATREVSEAISLVAFPAYAKLQDDLSRLRRAFLRTWESTACLTLPLALIVFLLAEELIRVVLGPQWLPTAPAVKILAMAGFMGSFVKLCGALFQGTGHPRLEMQLNLAQIVVTAALIYPLTRLMGISGAALSILLGTLATLPFLFRYLVIIRAFGLHDLLKASLAPLSIGLAVCAVTLLAKLGLDTGTLQGLVGIAALNLLVYVGMSCAFWWRFKSGPVQAIAALRSSR